MVEFGTNKGDTGSVIAIQWWGIDMNCRVYMHIGLPKTATTTLQLDYFPYVNHANYLFLGVLQPRSKKVSDPLFIQIISSARSGICIAETNLALRQRLDAEQKSLIISEEMLTVSSAEVSWQEQLSNLAKILEGIDYKLLVTIREPVSAMFSFYLELYEHFQEKGREFKRLALSDNEFRIFHYDSLLTELTESYDINRVYFQKFEDLVESDFSAVARCLDQPSMEPGFSTLNNYNQKKKMKNGVLVPKRLKLRWITHVYHWLGGEQNKFARRLKWMANKPVKKLRRVGFQTVAVPALSDDDRHELKAQMAGKTEEMAERFGVRY